VRSVINHRPSQTLLLSSQSIAALASSFNDLELNAAMNDSGLPLFSDALAFANKNKKF
jgi:hypothetical protein